MSLHFFNNSIVDSVEANQSLNSLDKLVERAHHTATNFIRLMGKFPLASNNGRIEHVQLEQQKIYHALCQATVRLDTLYNALPAEKPFLQKSLTGEGDEADAVHLTA